MQLKVGKRYELFSDPTYVIKAKFIERRSNTVGTTYHFLWEEGNDSLCYKHIYPYLNKPDEFHIFDWAMKDLINRDGLKET